MEINIKIAINGKEEKMLFENYSLEGMPTISTETRYTSWEVITVNQHENIWQSIWGQHCPVGHLARMKMFKMCCLKWKPVVMCNNWH